MQPLNLVFALRVIARESLPIFLDVRFVTQPMWVVSP
jgi:hypothetical protein